MGRLSRFGVAHPLAARTRAAFVRAALPDLPRPALEHAEIWSRSRHLAVVEGGETTDAIDITYK